MTFEHSHRSSHDSQEHPVGGKLSTLQANVCEGSRQAQLGSLGKLATGLVAVRVQRHMSVQQRLKSHRSMSIVLLLWWRYRRRHANVIVVIEIYTIDREKFDP